LRSPSGTQRRQQKRQGASSSNPGVATHSNLAAVPSNACSSSDDSRAQNVVDEFFQPDKVNDFMAFNFGVVTMYECFGIIAKTSLVALRVVGNSELAFSSTFSANLGADC